MVAVNSCHPCGELVLTLVCVDQVVGSRDPVSKTGHWPLDSDLERRLLWQKGHFQVGGRGKFKYYYKTPAKHKRMGVTEPKERLCGGCASRAFLIFTGGKETPHPFPHSTPLSSTGRILFLP